MALMKPKPSAPKAIDPAPVQITTPEYRGVTVDSRFTPLANLLQHVEGSSWAVNYYSQVVDRDSELSPLQEDRPAVYQQYRLIQAMELKVTTPLTMSQDPESKSMIASGSATTYPPLIPNKGDMFLADIGDGREGVFTITTAEKKTYLKESYYYIEYVLKGYSDVDTRADLERKTIETTRFVKDFANFGQNPKVLAQDFTQLIDFKKQYRELLNHYFSDFFSRDNETFLIPGQEVTSYDPFLAKALVSWIGTEEHPFVKRIRLPNVDGDKRMQALTLWDCISKMSADLLSAAIQEIRLIETTHFKSLPHYGSVYFTNIKRVVFPIDERTDVDKGYDHQCPPPLPGSPVTVGGRRYASLPRLVPSSNLNGFSYAVDENNIPDIARVTSDDYYVLSGAFYNDAEPLSSHLERITLQALRQEPIDKIALSRLLKTAMQWENVERFYYHPILLAILKVIVRTN